MLNLRATTHNTKGKFMEIGIVKNNEISNEILMPISSLTQISPTTAILQINTSVVGYAADQELQKVLDMLFPDHDNSEDEEDLVLCIKDGNAVFEEEEYVGYECYFHTNDIKSISLNCQKCNQMTFIINIDKFVAYN